MNTANRFSRRSFLQSTSAAAAALTTAGFLPGPRSVSATEPSGKLNTVVIGCGGRGMSHVEAAGAENLVAVVDVDPKRIETVRKWAKVKHLDPAKIQAFDDYRKMFDTIGKTVDAVFIATPNHQHALPAMIAMQLGKGVYVEKPMCHDVAEARKLREMAAQYKVATQMGNQGHCMEGYRRLCEYVWAGAIGNITETHSWSNRANGGIGPRPATSAPPEGMNWDAWIGPAPFRDYHIDLHPHEWHGWYDFGNGSLGNLGCHVLDGVYWALKLEHPTSIEVEEMFGGTDERYPTGTRIRWDFPARESMAPVKAYWYDGRVGAGDYGDGNKAVKQPKNTPKRPQNLPPLLVELKKKYPSEKFDGSGTLYVGDKGILYTATYGGNMHIVPQKQMLETPEPPKTLARPKGSFADFIRACKAGTTDTATSFDYASRLTEFTLLGNLAQRAGVGKKVMWDGPNAKVTNSPELNQWISREYRKGWGV